MAEQDRLITGSFYLVDEPCVILTQTDFRTMSSEIHAETEKLKNSLAFANAQIAGMQVEINNLNELLDQYR